MKLDSWTLFNFERHSEMPDVEYAKFTQEANKHSFPVAIVLGLPDSKPNNSSLIRFVSYSSFIAINRNQARKRGKGYSFTHKRSAPHR
jgi:hypothetical protein